MLELVECSVVLVVESITGHCRARFILIKTWIANLFVLISFGGQAIAGTNIYKNKK